MKIQHLLLIPFIATLTLSCSKNALNDVVTEADEFAQQIGDINASIDESSGQDNGTYAMLGEALQKTIARYEPKSFDISKILVPKALATACGVASTFSACAANTITRTFGNCTIGSATFSGTVVFAWSGTTAATCKLTAANDFVSRSPSFTATGVSGYNLTVSTVTTGQSVVLTNPAGNKTFNFTNSGVRRVLKNAANEIVFDHTTATITPIVITGTTRSNRVINGGVLRITNNVSGLTCDYTPTNVTWWNTCNCPISGTWSATCSDGKTATLTHNACKTANYTRGTANGSITFDRCFGT